MFRPRNNAHSRSWRYLRAAIPQGTDAPRWPPVRRALYLSGYAAGTHALRCRL